MKHDGSWTTMMERQQGAGRNTQPIHTHAHTLDSGNQNMHSICIQYAYLGPLDYAYSGNMHIWESFDFAYYENMHFLAKDNCAYS